MISRSAIINCARTYIDTPFHHNGRKKKSGIDCAGLLVCIARELGIEHIDAPAYCQFPDGVTLKKFMDASADSTCIKCAGPGDIVGFWFDKKDLLQHLGVLTDRGLLHVYATSRRGCIETSFSPRWQKRLMYAWKFRDIEPLEEFEPADLTDTSDPLQYRRCDCGNDSTIRGR